MTPKEKCLAIADAALVASWILMNFFWMWSLYAPAIGLAFLVMATSIGTLYFTERTMADLCICGANVAWAVVDVFWMLENGKFLPSGLYWASGFTALTLLLAGLGLFSAVAHGTLLRITERIKRVHALVRRN